MKLYDGGRAPNPRRVQIFLAEKGIEVPRIQVDINKLEQREARFAEINPLKRLPVLVLADGTIISESVAICRYFEEIVPEPVLMGRGTVDKAIVEMWQRRVELGLMMPVAAAFRHLHPGAAHLENPQIAEWGKLNQPRAREFLELLDDELADREFVAGEEFCIADITAFVSYQFLKPARIAYPEDLTNLQRWYQSVSQRPSVAL
ncbi:MAG: glutathione S-transferase family protein [Rhizobiaceae bacterium]